MKGNRKIFDGYVSYDEVNRADAWKLVEKLEKDFQLELCIPQRDLLGANSYVEVTSELIMNRCRTTLLFITPEFADSQECKFHAEILFHLSRGKDSRRHEWNHGDSTTDSLNLLKVPCHWEWIS